MADGFDLHLDNERAERLKFAADASGVSLTEFALRALDKAVADDWAEDDRRWAEYEATGESIPAEEAIARFRQAVRTKLADR